MIFDSHEIQDTEVTLSTGKLLAIFFGLVAICGVFFSLGYAVGKNSAPAASTIIMDSAQVASVSSSGGSKPGAGRATRQKPCGEGDPSCAEESAAQPTPAPSPSDGESSDSPPEASAPAPELQPGSGYMVQVAAVSKQEDANALVTALRRKQYPVLLVNNASSHLFHVQVGPFSDRDEAEAMRSRLAGDGYNAILKK
jgi:DedD protein